MKKFFRKIARFLPTIIVLYIDYGRSYKKLLNLKNPEYFGEKIQWIKLYGNLEKYSKFVDKYEVREFIKETIGEKYLNKIYGVYNNPSEIDFTKLPDRFVIKITNGSEGNIICRDKSKLNIDDTIKKLSKWQKEKFYKYTKEMQYKYVKSRIICEEYLEDETGSLRDFKFHCFDGTPRVLKVDTDRFSGHKENYYDTDWNEIGIIGRCPRGGEISKPSNLDEMINVCKILSNNFHYVRVDLYLVHGNIYFGELTLTSYNGTDPWYPLELDKKYASLIDIKKYNCQ